MFMPIDFTDVEIEKDRQDALRKIPKDVDPVGDFSMHEALDRTSVVMDILDRTLLDHHSIVNNPKFYKMAHEAHTMLFNLYQEIGNVHL